ncbi:MAG TPA: TIGR02281 family clan AA aspartic protease [Rickettsiales bacterium]|nr:TIGR02281 family clan AA aspartic protease [Rickettsiales bacterium]
MLRIFIILGLLVGFALLVIVFPYALHDEFTRYRAYSLLLLLLVVAARIRPGRFTSAAPRNALIWIGIFIVMVLAISFKDDVMNSRIGAAFFPRHIQVMRDGTMHIHASSGGNFLIEGKVNDVPVLFLVDTGASDIVLSPYDAKRAGLQPETLNYNRSYSTANGYGEGAGVMLGQLEIGNVRLRGEPASVNKAEMDISLLGMRFLRQLKSFRFEGDTLILTP